MSRPKALALVAISLALGMSTWFSATAVLPQLRSLWSLSATEAAWLTIAVQLGFVTGSLAVATLNLADRFPSQRITLVAAVAAAVANGLLAAAPGLAVALPLRFLTGAFVAGIYPPALKLAATHFRTGRGVALGLVVGALTVGSAVPHLVRAYSSVDWRALVLITSVLTLAGGAVAAAVPDGPYPFRRGPFRPDQVGRIFRDPALRLTSLGYFGHMWELYAMWSWFGVFFAESLSASGIVDAAVLAPLGTFFVIGVGALGAYLGGVLGDRWGRARTTALAMGLSGSCAALIGLTFGRSPLLLLAVATVWGVTVVADSAQFSAIVTEVADQAYVGTALTTQLAIGFSLTVATIWIVPLVRDAVGWQWAFMVLVPGPALGALAMLRLSPRVDAPR
jgi:MFS family permease